MNCTRDDLKEKYEFILFFKIVLGKIISVHQTAAIPFAFSSVLILFLCVKVYLPTEEKESLGPGKLLCTPLLRRRQYYYRFGDKTVAIFVHKSEETRSPRLFAHKLLKGQPSNREHIGIIAKEQLIF